MNYDIIYLFIIQNYLLKLALYFQEIVRIHIVNPGSLAIDREPRDQANALPCGFLIINKYIHTRIAPHLFFVFFTVE